MAKAEEGGERRGRSAVANCTTREAMVSQHLRVGLKSLIESLHHPHTPSHLCVFQVAVADDGLAQLLPPNVA
jgi:hypothetical protein